MKYRYAVRAIKIFIVVLAAGGVASASAFDRAQKFSNKNEFNPACKVYFLVDFKGAVSEHGQDMTYKWLEKTGSKKQPDACFTINRSKSSYVLTLSAGQPVFMQRTGTKTVTNTTEDSQPVSGTVYNTTTGETSNINGTINSTTTTTSTVPYTYTTGFQSIYGYVNGVECGETMWAQSDNINLYGGIAQKHRNDGNVHNLLQGCLAKVVPPVASSPPVQNGHSTTPATEQTEPDCGVTTEEEARQAAIAWASKHPEYRPTTENAQKVVGYMESHRLCPTQQNFDMAYRAVQSELDSQPAVYSTKSAPEQTVLMLDGRGGAFNQRFAAECPEVGMAFPFERGQPESQWAVALVSQPSPAWILFSVPGNGTHVVLAPERDVDNAVRRACGLVKKPETATWVPN